MPRNNQTINVEATIEATVNEAKRALERRLRYELRYHPRMFGEIGIRVKIQNGVPRNIEETGGVIHLVEPITDD